MQRIPLPASTAPGPTKPEVRAILLALLDVGAGDHLVDIGAGTGAVSIEAARAGTRVTAVERDPDRVEAIRTNLDAAEVESSVTVLGTTAPEGLPEEADAVFIGGTQNLQSVLDWVERVSPRTVVLNAARLETAVAAIESFEDRAFGPTLRRIEIGRGEDLAGETAIVPDRPVYMIHGTPEEDP